MSRHLMAKMRRTAAPLSFGEWQHGVVLPHTQRDMIDYNARGRVPRPTTHPDDEWNDGPMRPDEVWRPEDTSTKFVGHGERMHALQVTTNDANADGIDDPVGFGSWAAEHPEPWSWSIHQLHGDDPNDPDHWEHLGEIHYERGADRAWFPFPDDEAIDRGLGRADGQYGNFAHPSETHPHGDGSYNSAYTTSQHIEQIGGHWGYARSHEEAMDHAERAWDAHVRRSGWSGEGGDQHHGAPEPDPFGPRTDIDDDFGDIFGGGK